MLLHHPYLILYFVFSLTAFIVFILHYYLDPDIKAPTYKKAKDVINYYSFYNLGKVIYHIILHLFLLTSLIPITIIIYLHKAIRYLLTKNKTK